MRSTTMRRLFLSFISLFIFSSCTAPSERTIFIVSIDREGRSINPNSLVTLAAAARSSNQNPLTNIEIAWFDCNHQDIPQQECRDLRRNQAILVANELIRLGIMRGQILILSGRMQDADFGARDGHSHFLSPLTRRTVILLR